jgi:hypothetical protein
MGNAASAATGPSELLRIEQLGAVLAVGLNRGAERQEAKLRIRAFLDRKTAKVKPN